MGNNQTLISIIMPSLNVKAFMEECILSVINQSLKNIEIICVDAGSTDGTLEIINNCAQKDSRIKVYHSDKKSYGYQMNLGISKAQGEYIGIVETDDFIDEKMYETLYGLTDNGRVDIAKVNFYHYYDESSKRIDSSKKNLPEKPFTVYDNADILNGHPSIWAAIYKKSFLKENNIAFMEAPGGGWVDNPFLFETFLSAKTITYKDEPFYYYRELNPSSSTNDLKDLTLPMTRMMDNLDVIERYACHDEDILTALYVRIFWHIHDLVKRESFKNQETEVREGFYNVLSRVDEDIIKRRFKLKDQKAYYKYVSPIGMLDFDDNNSVELSKKDYENILKENVFLYKRINALENQNSKLNKKNKTLKKENQKLNDKISEFKSRKVIKLVDKFKN
ncbi:glycosyltransferase [Methanobrevibacter sp.]|uniref:glycosyltransferase n=1 Tax=Methanobrevibacter sp. TaxID=66852 RepID=UPI003867A1D4